MRHSNDHQHNTTDPFDAEWADELRNAVVTELSPDLVAATAHQAALASGAAVASIASAAAASGTAIGGNTMTTATATMTGTATAGASAMGAKLAAIVVAGATVTGGLAATGNLPDAAQSATADLVSKVGIELPRPDLAGIIAMVDVGSAGTVSLSVVDGALEVADLAAVGGWDAAIAQTATDELTVTFTQGESTLILDASLATDGSLVTEVAERSTVQPAGPQGSVTGEVDGSAGAGIDTDPIEIDSQLDVGGSVGIGLNN